MNGPKPFADDGFEFVEAFLLVGGEAARVFKDIFFGRSFFGHWHVDRETQKEKDHLSSILDALPHRCT